MPDLVWAANPVTDQPELRKFVCEHGYLAAKKLPSGLAFVEVTAAGNGRITVGDPAGRTVRYTFFSPAAALVALHRWDGDGDPDGWLVHDDSDGVT